MFSRWPIKSVKYCQVKTVDASPIELSCSLVCCQCTTDMDVSLLHPGILVDEDVIRNEKNANVERPKKEKLR